MNKVLVCRKSLLLDRMPALVPNPALCAGAPAHPQRGEALRVRPLRQALLSQRQLQQPHEQQEVPGEQENVLN